MFHVFPWRIPSARPIAENGERADVPFSREAIVTIEEIPYVTYSVPCAHYCPDCGARAAGKRFFCLCLVDHLVVGTGDSPDEALRAMRDRYSAKYPDGAAIEAERDDGPPALEGFWNRIRQ